MPISYLQPYNQKKKKCSILAILLFIPLLFNAQTTLTGLWIGATSNDSSTIRKDQSFELALTEYKGKVFGYSRSEFIVNDTLYYIVKRVKGEIKDDTCLVTDDDIVAHNFFQKPDKGVKVTSTFVRNSTDSTWRLDGKWKTNATKKYYSVTGKVGLAEEKDLTASKIFPHLEELSLANDIAFYRERIEQPAVVKVVRPESKTSVFAIKSIESKSITINLELPPVETFATASVAPTEIKNASLKGVAISTAPVSIAVAKPDSPVPENDYSKSVVAIKNSNSSSKASIPITSSAPITVNQISTPVVKNNPVKEEVYTYPEDISTVAKTKTAPTPTSKSNSPLPTANTTSIAAVAIKPKMSPVKTNTEITSVAAVVSGRKSVFAQEVNFASDSLVIALYDNGEIDGDTVSVYVNGQLLMAKQGLKANAIKKTIHITPGNEDFSLVLFADNLGKYPPNTGLLVVYDGEDTYNLRFSSDFQKNAGIVFKRKR